MCFVKSLNVIALVLIYHGFGNPTSPPTPFGCDFIFNINGNVTSNQTYKTVLNYQQYRAFFGVEFNYYAQICFNVVNTDCKSPKLFIQHTVKHDDGSEYNGYFKISYNNKLINVDYLEDKLGCNGVEIRDTNSSLLGNYWYQYYEYYRIVIDYYSPRSCPHHSSDTEPLNIVYTVQCDSFNVNGMYV